MYKHLTIASWLIIILLALGQAACRQPAVPATDAITAGEVEDIPYKDARRPTDERVEDLLGRMSLEEKMGQMTLVEKNSIVPGRYHRSGHWRAAQRRWRLSGK